MFTIATNSVAWACGKSNTKTVVLTTVSKCQKTCCNKAQSSSKTNCQSACCSKHLSDSHKQKKGCCGDDNCSCSVSTTVLADLPKPFVLNISNPLPVFVFKNDFFYKQVFTSASFNDIWQPPISISFI
jgi:hypothetical protein